MSTADWPSDGPRIALDVGPLRSQPAGVGVYVANLAAGLAATIGDSLGLIGVRADASALDPIRAASRQSFRFSNYHAWLQLDADRQARRAGARLVHYTNAGTPLVTRLPHVLTVHDLSLIRHPRTHPAARLATVPIMLWAIARARAVIVPSKWTRQELARLPIAGRRTVVIPHAPAPVPDDLGESDPLALLGVADGHFVLAVGTIEPRKNVVRLVEAFERLATARPSLRLVLAGAPGWHCDPILARIEASPVADRIVVAGYLSSAAIATLTRASAAVAYVSIYEGFGMPVLDSMGIGAAVVASNRTAMPEAAGGAAVLVDPLDSADIARGLERAFAERAALINAGRTRAAERTWADVAGEHIELYRWALTGS